MHAIADFLRARGTTVVLGGLHATLLPGEAAEHADAVVAGEGELRFSTAYLAALAGFICLGRAALDDAGRAVHDRRARRCP